MGLACGVIAAVGSAVLIALGHRPWYAWVTLVVALGNVWVLWSVGGAAASPAEAVADVRGGVRASDGARRGRSSGA